MKTPSYYRHKPHEIERAFLVYVPDAPRVSPDSATDWEALCDESGVDNGAGGDASSKVSGCLFATGNPFPFLLLLLSPLETGHQGTAFCEWPKIAGRQP